jgi:hypothetical protein
MPLVVSKTKRIANSRPLITIEVQKSWSEVNKANPYKDPATGRFTTGGASSAGSSKTEVLEGSGFTDADKHTDLISSAFYAEDASEINATGIEYYTSTGYKDMNTLLRKDKIEGGKFERDIAQESIEALDSEISKNVAPRDLVLFRGVTGDDASKTFGKLKEGDVFTDKGFVSTTPDSEMVQEFMSSASGQKFDSRPIEKGYVLQVHVPQGENVFSVHQYFKKSGRDSDGMFERENEHILPRGASFRVNSIGTIQVRGNLVDKLIDVTMVSK